MDLTGSADNTALNEEKFTDQLAYWKQRLGGPTVALELPIDRSHPPIQTFEEAHVPFVLSGALSAAIETLSQQEEVPLFVTLLAAFLTLLHRYTGQVDLLVGARGAGSTQVDLGDFISFFPDTLVLRTDVSGNPTFRELLGRVREVMLEAHAQQDMPFERLLEALQPERDALFQVMFVLEDASVVTNTWTKRCDLTLRVEDTAQGLRGQLEYNAALFNVETITRLVGHWHTLLGGVVADPERRLSELPLLTEAERRQVLVEWNATQTAYPKDQAIHQLFEAQVERTPDAVAVVYKDTQLTYRELNQRANQLAHNLVRVEVGPEVLVGVCMERSLEMIVGLLGILKAGGGYVPLDPAYPQERLAFMLQDAQVSVLLTQQRLVEGLPRQAAHVLCLDTSWGSIAQESAQNPMSRATPGNLAYVIYTSGSTGKPKGVAIEHRSTVAFIHWALSVFTPEELAGVLASTSICFDLSVFELFVPLSCGGAVLLVENALHLPSLPVSRPVTLLNTVPSAAAELAYRGSIPASVQTVNLAGEPLHGSLVRQLYRQETIRRVFNLYGPTEDTTYSTYVLVEVGEREPSIGRPIANTQVYIVDPYLRPVPIGIVGELYIGGDGLARGYLNRPELTAERFISNPFSQQPDARLYKTGDLARYLPDGNIEFLGRIDHQVKIRGYRIELGEIEAALGQHPEVREAVVMAREETPGDKRLVAYIVAMHEQAPTITLLRSFLKEKLPEYMIPSAFVFLAALPLTPNGKVDRRALPAPEPSRSMGGERFAAPRVEVHQQLIQIWEELLEVRPIGIRDNFFELGGHSLLAVRLVDRIEQVWGKKIAVATLLAGATIEQLSDVLTQPADSASMAVPGAGHANGARRTSPIRSIWSSLIGRRGR